MELQKTPNSQSNLEEENKIGGTTLPDFKQLQNYTNQNSVISA